MIALAGILIFGVMIIVYGGGIIIQSFAMIFSWIMALLAIVVSLFVSIFSFLMAILAFVLIIFTILL
jgi:hypothetical protein